MALVHAIARTDDRIAPAIVTASSGRRGEEHAGEIPGGQRIVQMFLKHKVEIRHPDPKAAVPVGLMMVIGTLFEVIVMPTDLGPLRQFLPDDAGLKRELTRAFVNYLGAPPVRT